MKRLAALGAVLLAVASLEPPARAADWNFVQGTEPKGAPAVRPFGVVQVTAEGIVAEPVRGLGPGLSAFEGQRASFNVLSSGAPWSVAVRRARPGLRGVIPGTGEHVSYYLLAELGTVPLARDGPTLADAAITLSYVPGARVRVGQFRLPLMDEGMESNAMAAEWPNLTSVANTLVMENPVAKGAYAGGASGFRDVGVEVFDAFQLGHMALSYSVALTNGRRGEIDVDGAKDVTARTMASWVFSGAPTDAHRQELSLFAWGQRGERKLDGVVAQRIRSGVGVHLEKEPVRVRAELVYASGAIFGGPSPSFAGQPLAVDATGHAIGGYVQARIRVLGKGSVGLRYDELRRGQGDPKALRISRSLTPMVEWDPAPRVRVQASYEKRWLAAPGASVDARTIAATMGDRLDAQVTVLF